MAGQAPRPPVKFFTNHAVVLYWIAFNPESRVADIAATIGMSHRAAQAIVTDLAEGGFVIRRRSGRRNAYSIVPGKLLHPPSGQPYTRRGPPGHRSGESSLAAAGHGQRRGHG